MDDSLKEAILIAAGSRRASVEAVLAAHGVAATPKPVPPPEPVTEPEPIAEPELELESTE